VRRKCNRYEDRPTWKRHGLLNISIVVDSCTQTLTSAKYFDADSLPLIKEVMGRNLRFGLDSWVGCAKVCRHNM
jgi:hypothetical protein